jgi:uncharacterized membrane protein required for colicin V production
MNIFDIIILIIIIISILSCYSKGLVKSLFGMFGVIVALFIAINLAGSVGSLLRNNETVYSFVYSAVSSFTASSEQPETNGIADSISSVFSLGSGADLKTQAEAIRQIDIPSSIINGILSNDTAQRIIAEYITNFVINVLAVIVVFIVALIALRMLAGILDFIAKLPILNLFNKLGGALIGFLQGIISVWIIITIIKLLPVNEFMVNCYSLIEASWIAVRFI